jgi:hypothetical protein
VDQEAEVEMSRLLLGELGAVLLHVAVLSRLRDGVSVHGELDLASLGVLEASRELSVDDDVGITPDGRGKVGVERGVEGVVRVLMTE